EQWFAEGATRYESLFAGLAAVQNSQGTSAAGRIDSVDVTKLRSDRDALAAQPIPDCLKGVRDEEVAMADRVIRAVEGAQKANGLLDRAKAAGYNGALVGDVKLGRLDDAGMLPIYFTNLKATLEHARTLGMDVIPGTADFGYSETILWHDPNLAEGLPVK